LRCRERWSIEVQVGDVGQDTCCRAGTTAVAHPPRQLMQTPIRDLGTADLHIDPVAILQRCYTRCKMMTLLRALPDLGLPLQTSSCKRRIEGQSDDMSILRLALRDSINTYIYRETKQGYPKNTRGLNPRCNSAYLPNCTTKYHTTPTQQHI
jgi:hypothetical protein